ncbi:uncharacterized protein [Watersipora subatra]|uniref:uncharacterized protein n=1 Tax=Watersipora subatra TaxID=2589382 RepID=UPI00355BB9BE
MAQTPKYELVFRDISLQIGKQNILSHVNGLAKPGEMMAIMGPSGAGKTTLLNILAGRQSMDSGTLTMNSKPITKQLRRKISFVLQNDIFLSQLTCWETIWYTALLRLPGSMPLEEKKKRVHDIIDTLDMRKCLKTKVGDVGHRGLSGGERKRTTIACELLTNPSLMLLDEPTSGLDSSTAYSLCSAIKAYARSSGKTVIMTIHQPSSKIFNMFNQLLLLCEGKVAYYGEVQHCAKFFEGISLPCPPNYNLADHILDQVKEEREVRERIIQRAEKQREEAWYPVRLRSDRDTVEVVSELGHRETQALLNTGDGLQLSNMCDKSKNGKLNGNVTHTEIKLYPKAIEGKVEFDESTFYDDTDEGRFRKEYNAKWPTSFWNQYCVLTKRSFWQALPRILSKWHIIQVIVVAIMGGLLWLNMSPSEERLTDRHGLLFFGVVYCCFLTLIDAMLSFPADRTVLNKERLAGYYRLSAYYLAKLTSDLPLVLILPATHITITYWMAFINPNFWVFLRIMGCILLSSALSHSMSMAYSALILKMHISIMFCTTTMLLLTLSGGFYAKSVPFWLEWLKYASFLQHSYSAILNIDLNSIDIRCAEGSSSYPSCYSNGTQSTNSSRYISREELLKEYTMNTEGLHEGHHISIVLLVTIAAMASTYIILRFIRKPHLT